MLPFLTNDKPWFSFIGHPRHFVDLDRIGGTDLLRRYSVSEKDFLKKIGLIPPLVIGHIKFQPYAINGEVVAVMSMPDLMVTPRSRQAVLDGIKLSISRGARVIGLGALTAPATGAGISVVKEIPQGVTLTTGNAFTAAVAFRNVIEASNYVNNSDPQIAVLGCTGSVGFAVSHLLYQNGYRLTLIGRTVERVKTLFSDFRNVAFSNDLESLQKANIILALTNDKSAKILPRHLQTGAVVIDIAQPANVKREDYTLFKNQGIFITEGGLVQIPGYSCTFDFSLPPSSTFACLAETYLFAREGITEHSVGRALPELAKYLDQIATDLEITPLPLFI